MWTPWGHAISPAIMLAARAAAHADVDCDGGRGGYRFQTSDGWFQSDKLKHFLVDDGLHIAVHLLAPRFVLLLARLHQKLVELRILPARLVPHGIRLEEL